MTLSGESENGAKNNSVEWRKRERDRQTDREERMLLRMSSDGNNAKRSHHDKPDQQFVIRSNNKSSSNNNRRIYLWVGVRRRSSADAG